EKYPGFLEWQSFTFRPGCEGEFPNHGAGVLLGDVVAIDIDVDDASVAAAIEDDVRKIVGLGDAAEIPRRIGRPPRVLLPFRAKAPFRKITTAFYKLHSMPDARSKVEVLATGQQFVAYAVHPDTRRPYAWNGGGDLLTVSLAELPEIDEKTAREIVHAAEEILAQHGERIGDAL